MLERWILLNAVLSGTIRTEGSEKVRALEGDRFSPKPWNYGLFQDEGMITYSAENTRNN